MAAARHAARGISLAACAALACAAAPAGATLQDSSVGRLSLGSDDGGIGHSALARAITHDGRLSSVSHDGEDEYTDAVIYLVVALAMGMLTRLGFGRAKLPVPYTVAVMLEGFATGLAVRRWLGAALPGLARSYNIWTDIDPHLFLFIFLPILLFVDSMCLKWEVLKSCAWQCLLLAGLGSAIGTLITGAVAHYAMPYGWDWPMSLCFGSILSATDPVAVSTLLSELGCSQVLAMQIAGESLLNDGVAIVLWSVSFSVVKGQAFGIVRMALAFGRLAVGGAVVGVACGILAVACLHRMTDRYKHDHVLLQICFLLWCAYTVYYVAEDVVGCSGVLATVLAAITLGRAARPLIIDEHAMLSFWHVAEFVANTLVFHLAGALVFEGFRLAEPSFEDWCWVVYLYVALVAIRGLMILAFYPALRRLGPGMRWRDGVVMVWGGLRGAVGLALAVAVDEDASIGRADGARFMFHVGGIAFLTLTVNATTCEALIVRLGMARTGELRAAMLRQLESQLGERMQAAYAELSRSRRFQGHHRRLLKRWVSALDVDGAAEAAPPPDEAPESEAPQEAVASGAEGPAGPAPSVDLVAPGPLAEVRSLFYAALKGAYRGMIREGSLPHRSQMAIRLLNSADRGALTAHAQLCDLAILLDGLRPGSAQQTRLAAALEIFWGNLCDGTLSSGLVVPVRRQFVEFDLCGIVSLVDAHSEAQIQLSELGAGACCPPELTLAIETVLRESRLEVNRANSFLALNHVSTYTVGIVRTRQLALKLVFDATQLLHRWVQTGALEESEAQRLSHSLHRSYLSSGELMLGANRRSWQDPWETEPLEFPDETGVMARSPGQRCSTELVAVATDRRRVSLHSGAGEADAHASMPTVVEGTTSLSPAVHGGARLL